MKQNQITVVLFVFLFTSLVTWPQTVGVPVEGKVTQEGQPLANAQVVLTNIDNGKTYKTKTDKTGAFSMVGVPRGNFNVEVLGEKGEKLFKQPTAIGSEQGGTGANAFMTIDVPKGGAAGLDVSAPKLTKEEIAKIEADNKKIAGRVGPPGAGLAEGRKRAQAVDCRGSGKFALGFLHVPGRSSEQTEQVPGCG